jgi:hemoglobin-like flavoprotein
MAPDVRLLRDTLELTLAADDSFPARFYQRLFADHPSVAPLFHRNSTGAQHKMFAQKLVALVDHLDDPGWLERELAGLAASHAGYGVTAEMYPWVGGALVATLREACGPAWTEAAEQAWLEAYDRLTRAIIAAPRPQ